MPSSSWWQEGVVGLAGGVGVFGCSVGAVGVGFCSAGGCDGVGVGSLG